MHYLSYCSATFCSFLLISCSCLHLFLCGFVFVLSCLVFSFYFCSPLCFIYLFQMQEFWSTGVLTAKTRCWAQGMDGWRPLQAIPQLKWCLLATGQAVMNESDLATLILNMLITMCSYYPSRWDPLKLSLWLCERQINHLSSFTTLFYVLYTVGFINCFSLLRDQDNAIIRPLPKIKRMIADNACLPHIVQVVAQFVLKLCHMTRWYSSLNWIKCLSLSSAAAPNLWPHSGGKGGQCSVPGDAGQPQPAASLFDWCLLLHHDVHRLQRASCGKVKARRSQLAKSFLERSFITVLCMYVVLILMSVIFVWCLQIPEVHSSETSIQIRGGEVPYILQ